MTPRPNADDRIDAFLSEGTTDVPDRVFDAVRGEIHRTRQRAVLGRWAAPRFGGPSVGFIAAALVLAIALLGFDLFARVGPGQAPPSAQPTATPALREITSVGRLEPGRYAVRDADGGPAISILLTGDFRALRTDWIELPEGDPIRPTPALSVQTITATYSDPCTGTSVVTAAPGPGLPDVISMLAQQPGIFVERRTAIAITGFSGEQVDLKVAADACLEGFRPWAGARFVMLPLDRVRVIVVDVRGARLSYFAFLPESAPVYEHEVLLDAMESIEVLP